MRFFGYLFDPEKWGGPEGILALCGQHLGYTLVTLMIAGAIGFPFGVYVGHTGRGVTLVAGLANALRALPSLGLLVLLVILCGPLFTSDLAFAVPSLIVLVLLAVPPIMTTTYAGIAAVDPAAVDAARGMAIGRSASSFMSKFPARCRSSFPACGMQRCRSYPRRR